MYHEGYETYKPGSFTVRSLGYGDMVLVTSEKLKDELRKAPENELSMNAGMDEVGSRSLLRVVYLTVFRYSRQTTLLVQQ